MAPDQCALFASGSQAAAEAPPREPPRRHVHMRRLGLDTGPLQHVPLASQVLIKGFFTHPAAALLSGLGRGSASCLAGWSCVPCLEACWAPWGSRSPLLSAWLPSTRGKLHASWGLSVPLVDLAKGTLSSTCCVQWVIESTGLATGSSWERGGIRQRGHHLVITE